MTIQQNRPDHDKLQTRPLDGVEKTSGGVQQKTVECTISGCKKVIDEMYEQGWKYKDGIDKRGNDCVLIFTK
jgi:hypothetical protein